MSNELPSRAAVIGGGVIGVSSAYHLARQGAKVYLVTEGGLASGASGRSLSWINAGGMWAEHYYRFRMIGIDRYRTLFARQPTQNWLRFDGGLRWQSAEQADVLSEMHERELARGYDSQLLTGDEVAARIPGVNAEAIPTSGAIWNPGEGWIDLPSLINYLVKELVDLGGELITDAGKASVHLDTGRVTEIKTEHHPTIEVDAVLLAAGSSVPELAAQLGVTIPDATNTALLIKTHPLETPLRAVLNTSRVSLRPAPDGGLAVDAAWTESHIEVLADGTYRVPAETIDELLAEASRVLTGGPILRAATYGIGPKPIPGDGEPVLGQLGDMDGLYVAFTHSGATLALIIGELLAYEVINKRSHPLLAPFRPDRFIK
ncbi:MAG TPA: FAD-binding oxidoreductase [Propionibacteriaceae bacterium]|nr:FAD-binding oxidoreductase [Propionibacteriaceae bacterium]